MCYNQHSECEYQGNVTTEYVTLITPWEKIEEKTIYIIDENLEEYEKNLCIRH